jgi:release factor glutamine methyltransferase
MPELAVRLRPLLDECAELLRCARIAEPRREALLLWADISGTSPVVTLLGEHILSDSEVAELRQATNRRARGEPLSYVTGVVGFRHLLLRIDRRALIPRPETEGLVELLLERVQCGVVADIGTGSGCIALSLALEGSFTRVVAIDSSGESVALAEANAAALGCSTTIDFVQADLCTPLGPGSCHALISNPPYLTREEYARLDPSVRDWEPAVALRSGMDGMDATIGIIKEGRRVLKPAGWLALEVDCSRAATAAQMASRHGWQDVSIHKDLFGRERYLLARRSENGDLG